MKVVKYKNIKFKILNYWRRSIFNNFILSLYSKTSLDPISSKFGTDRGIPIDRYYIENFLRSHCNDVRGRVLEIGDDSYTRLFGGGKVLKSDVLHACPDNPKATIVSDLSEAKNIETNSFDCIILTQTLHVIYDFDSAIRNLHRILKKEGVLLATFPGISQISRYDMDRWGDYWRFTDLSIKKMFEKYFSKENIKIDTFGNVLVAVSFLHGLSLQEIKRKDLDYQDKDYQVLITLRAVK